MTYTLFSKPAKLDFPARLLPCNREPERTHDVSGHYLLSSRDSGGIVQAMGGRRSRYWCGRGIFRETKKAPVRGFIGQWSAPSFLKELREGTLTGWGRRSRPSALSEKITI